MKAVQIVIIILLQCFVCLGVAILVNDRIQWAQSTLDAARHGQDQDDMEPAEIPENALQTSSPFEIALQTGDVGLNVTVIFLALLFMFSFLFRKSLPHNFNVYMTIFLVVVLVAESLLIVHQQLVLPGIHRAYAEFARRNGGGSSRPVFTTEHGAKIKIGSVIVRATVRDPNIIPLLMIAAFFVPWFGLQKKVRRRRDALARNATDASAT